MRHRPLTPGAYPVDRGTILALVLASLSMSQPPWTRCLVRRCTVAHAVAGAALVLVLLVTPPLTLAGHTPAAIPRFTLFG